MFKLTGQSFTIHGSSVPCSSVLLFKYLRCKEILHEQKIINTTAAPAPIVPYNQAVQAGNFLFISAIRN